MKKIFAFGHQKSVGKDELIKFCIDILRPQMRASKIVRRGFADKLYDFCHSVYAWAGFKPRVYYTEHPNAKNDILATGFTVRDTLIKVGNKLREWDIDIWINANLRSEDFDILFISDLRYPNEFLQCQALGAKLINITRPGLPVPTDEADTALNGWEKKWDLTIENNTDLNGLYKHAETIVKEYILV